MARRGRACSTLSGLSTTLICVLWVFSRASPSMGLRLIGPELVLEPPSTAVLSNTTGVLLRCAALATPPPSITWVTEQGSPLTPVPNVREVLPNGSLFLSAVQPHASHPPSHSTYRCHASNTAGTVISRACTVSSVSWTSGLSSGGDGSLDGGEGGTRAVSTPVSVGGVGIIRCTPPRYIPALFEVVSWLVSSRAHGTPFTHLPDAGRYVYGGDMALYITDITREDASKQYRCRLRHAASRISLLSSPTTITVTDLPSEGPPRIDSSFPRRVEVVEGQTFTLACPATASRPPHFSWTRGGDVASVGVMSGMGGLTTTTSLVNGGRVWVRGAVMGIKRVRPEDGGSYSCAAATAQGTDTAHFTVTVVQHLSAVITPAMQDVTAGGRVVIRCEVRGTPVAEVRWYHDGRPLSPDGRVVLQGRNTLLLTAVGERDAGVYQCIVANSLGEAQASSHVRLKASAPELRYPFIEQTLQAGPSVSLKCEAIGYPPPVITWTVDGRPVTHQSGPFGGERVTVGEWRGTSTTHVTSFVNITSVAPLDGGEYRCEAVNTAGTTSHHARLNIYGPPVARSPHNMSVVGGREAVIPCPVAGYPISKITWAVHGRPLTPTQGRGPRPDGSLVLRPADPEHHVGRYMCTASSSQGRSASASFFLSIVKPPVLAEFTFPDSIVSGMRLSVSCSIMSGDLPISITWQRDGNPMPQDPDVTETHSQFFSNLVFSNIQGRHAGDYTCTASNSAASTAFTASMNVRVAPVWVVEAEDVVVVDGEDINLECHAQGTPRPSVTWRKIPENGDVGSAVALAVDGWRLDSRRTGSLTIRQATLADRGRYQCQADNGVSPALSKVVSVVVREGARIQGNRVINESATVGASLELRCRSSGDPPLVFQWSQGLKQLRNPPTGDLELRSGVDGRSSMLFIPRASRHHAGLYTCHVSNAFTSDAATFFVNVEERPDPPGQVHVVEVKSRHVSLKWAHPYDGNSPLTHYVVQHWPVRLSSPSSSSSSLIPSSTGSSSSSSSSSSSLAPTPSSLTNTTILPQHAEAIIKNLHPGTVYHLRMLALNSRGSSRPSPTLSVTTLQEPPSSAPTSVQAHSKDQDSISVSWQPPSKHQTPGSVTAYQVGFREASSAGSAGVGTTGDLFTYRTVKAGINTQLLGLRPFTAYAIVVRAVNSVGAGPPSHPTIVTTRQGVPSEAPGQVQCTPLSSQALRVRWDPLAPNSSNGIVQGYKVLYKRVSNIEGSNPLEVKRTTNLETSLQNLLPFTNFSVRVLAFTAPGDGKASDSVTCATLQDAPESPREIKAVTSGPGAVVLAWLPPANRHGILTHYTLHYRPLNAQQSIKTMDLDVRESDGRSWAEVSREVDGLDPRQRYEGWVTAATRIGDGPQSSVVAFTPSSTVSARVVSFGQTVAVVSGQPLSLPCTVVGDPQPVVEWKKHGAISNFQTLGDHSLYVASVSLETAGNYSCLVYNTHGRDEERWSVFVVTTPPPPTPRVQYTTETSIRLSWGSDNDGGKPITGYLLRYRREHETWRQEEVEARDTIYTLRDLRCGSTYQVQVSAVSSVGRGVYSPTVTTRTKGAAPRQPRHRDLISANATSLTLHLYTWPSGGCPMVFWVVEYRPHTSRSFTPVATNLPGDTDELTLPDLTPLTWYQLRVTAHNHAGSTTALYDVATSSTTGATLAPDSVVEASPGGDVPFYADPHVLAPVISGIACTLALLLCVVLAVTRGRRYRNGKNAEVAYSRGVPEVDNLHNDSREQLRPAEAKRDEAYGTTAWRGHTQSPEISCISNQQTLPVSSSGGGNGGGVVGGRGRLLSGGRRRSSDSEQEGGSPVATAGGPANGKDGYKVPVRLRRGLEVTFHPPDSSTESNEERSPVATRRPMPLPASATAAAAAAARGGGGLANRVPRSKPTHGSSAPYRASTPDSLYSLEGAVGGGGPLRPPTGFSDSRELSEAECDRETRPLRPRGNHTRQSFPSATPNDYSIHV
ncbi:cell adhesion molecule Dscam2-like isoform X5 [Oratosquilla oratoria]|uniref:cell adhesion molecule Dscam2-like isoform X5 n=1 Tax=Oratosquilla oratoria TaxID=337810 RepID=UPI003F767D38